MTLQAPVVDTSEIKPDWVASCLRKHVNLTPGDSGGHGIQVP